MFRHARPVDTTFNLPDVTCTSCKVMIDRLLEEACIAVSEGGFIEGLTKGKIILLVDKLIVQIASSPPRDAHCVWLCGEQLPFEDD